MYKYAYLLRFLKKRRRLLLLVLVLIGVICCSVLLVSKEVGRKSEIRADRCRLITGVAQYKIASHGLSGLMFCMNPDGMTVTTVVDPLAWKMP